MEKTMLSQPKYIQDYWKAWKIEETLRQVPHDQAEAGFPQVATPFREKQIHVE